MVRLEKREVRYIPATPAEREGIRQAEELNSCPFLVEPGVTDFEPSVLDSSKYPVRRFYSFRSHRKTRQPSSIVYVKGGFFLFNRGNHFKPKDTSITVKDSLEASLPFQELEYPILPTNISLEGVLIRPNGKFSVEELIGARSLQLLKGLRQTF